MILKADLLRARREKALRAQKKKKRPAKKDEARTYKDIAAREQETFRARVKKLTKKMIPIGGAPGRVRSANSSKNVGAEIDFVIDLELTDVTISRIMDLFDDAFAAVRRAFPGPGVVLLTAFVASTSLVGSARAIESLMDEDLFEGVLSSGVHDVDDIVRAERKLEKDFKDPLEEGEEVWVRFGNVHIFRRRG